MTDTNRLGACLCGAVSFEVRVPLVFYSICHCDMCRRWGAGPFMSVRVDGPPNYSNGEELMTWYRSSAWAERGFCSRCGSVLFWRLAEHPNALTVVSVDSLEDASDFTLHRHIFVDSQPERYVFADERPRLTEAEVLAELGIKPEDLA